MRASFGYANSGDEGILASIMDSLGFENEYIVSTSLPFTLTSEYFNRVSRVTDVRTLYDARIDFDAYLLGGGKIDWGFATEQLIRVMNAKIPVMGYGLGFRTDIQLSPGLKDVLCQFLNLFNIITVRDLASKNFFHITDLTANLARLELTMCPAINLKEEKTHCPERMIVACPRYGDYDASGQVNNEPQIEWFVSRLKDCKEEVLLIPFSPRDLEGHLRDLEVCNEISRRLGGCHIYPTDGYNPRKIKYAISKSKLVISGGRYHALAWAAAHGIPYEVTPTITGLAKSKIDSFIEIHQKYGSEKLKEMEKLNKNLFEGMTNVS